MHYIEGSMVGMFIAGLVTAAAGLLAAFDEEKKRLRKGIAWTTFIAGLVFITCSCWASINQAASSKKIDELNKRIADSITGGDSFCEFGFLQLEGQHEFVAASVTQHGDYPLYDVTADIMDQDKMQPIDRSNINWSVVLAAHRGFTIGNLSPGLSRTLEDVPLPQTNSIRYHILFSARNGWFSQDLRCLRTNAVWSIATKVTRNGRTIYERIDDGFPRGTNGTVNW